MLDGNGLHCPQRETTPLRQNVVVEDVQIRFTGLQSFARIRGKSEIAEELRALFALADVIPSSTGFGQSNIDAIRAQIMVIELHMTRDEDIDEFEDGDDYTLSAVLNLLDWLSGDDDERPSADWLNLI